MPGCFAWSTKCPRCDSNAHWTDFESASRCGSGVSPGHWACGLALMVLRGHDRRPFMTKPMPIGATVRHRPRARADRPGPVSVEGMGRRCRSVKFSPVYLRMFSSYGGCAWRGDSVTGERVKWKAVTLSAATRAELCGLRSRGFVGVRRLSVPGGDGALGTGDRAWGERAAGASSQSSRFPALVRTRDGNEPLAARKA